MQPDLEWILGGALAEVYYNAYGASTCVVQLTSSPLSPQTEDFSKSLFFLEATNPFRMLCRRVVEHRLFSHVMLVCILGSCVDMATYSPTQAETSHRNRLVRRIDIGFIAVFFLEMALKVSGADLQGPSGCLGW